MAKFYLSIMSSIINSLTFYNLKVLQAFSFSNCQMIFLQDLF